jgi:hypothetical protein
VDVLGCGWGRWVLVYWDVDSVGGGGCVGMWVG